MASFSLHTHDITEFFPIISLVYLMAKKYIYFSYILWLAQMLPCQWYRQYR